MKVQKYIVFTFLVLYSHVLFASSYNTLKGEYTTSGITLKVSFTKTSTTLDLKFASRTLIVNAYVETAGEKKHKHIFKIGTPKKNKRFNKSQTLTIDKHQQNIILHCQVKDSVNKPERIVRAELSITPNQEPQMGTLIIVGKTLVAPNNRAVTKVEQDTFNKLMAKIIIKKSKYKIDLAGRSVQQFAKEMRAISRKAFISGGTPLTKPTKLRIWLELTNTSDKDIKLELGGDKGDISVIGKGAGFLSITTTTTYVDQLLRGTGLTLKPGQKHRIHFSMTSGFRSSSHNFWTKPGNCSLSFYVTCLLHEQGWDWDATRINITVTGVVVKVNE
ncbi:hypothetical protein [Candidatus Uabimicrobium sp. HlEnr_7]|uniref:hypothetical protein n=1 Tax=Candidatus Uabimicrobium helgolandensis TaxID=3095367 RepID=UPI0035588004